MFLWVQRPKTAAENLSAGNQTWKDRTERWGQDCEDWERTKVRRVYRTGFTRCQDLWVVATDITVPLFSSSLHHCTVVPHHYSAKVCKSGARYCIITSQGYPFQEKYQHSGGYIQSVLWYSCDLLQTGHCETFSYCFCNSLFSGSQFMLLFTSSADIRLVLLSTTVIQINFHIIALC